MSDNITCICGKILPTDKSFSVYGKNFCSIKCLKPYKQVEDEKRKPKKSVLLQNINIDYGSCC
ncbi:hypothetical protein QJ854_gp207 [Moumouvirus goulette]|uniref:Uncharacterized protein n=1 Tax=Moumouvirus goulette TaxID=1247379 RepID=M1NNE2_9VIRU|nr:hypothetical protein QJ854_gp207 [Moumouvirus goulette]AGF85575.1 hypothetical protein glt_00770 [Moumouvirus goulette]